MALLAKQNVLAKGLTSTKSVAPLPARAVSRLPARKTAAPAKQQLAQQQVNTTATAALPVEAVEAAQPLYAISGEAGFITGTALTMVAMTLVGLALGFVLLRVESLVEEGKI